MAARIQLRRDTSSNWSTTNPTLNSGELGVETNTSKIKLGDGSTAWNSLDYVVYPLSFSDLLNKPTTIAGYGITDAFDGAFSSLVGTPTTLSGYGITDAMPVNAAIDDLSNVSISSLANNQFIKYNGTNFVNHTLTFADITSTPTTVAGYGITDALTTVSFAQLTGKPTTIAGYGITDAFDGAFSSLTGKPTTISGYGITDAFDGAFSSLTGTPTTIAGYGITDAFNGSFSALTGKPTTIAGYGITDAFDGAFSSLTGVPTTISGFGITDAFDGAFGSLTGRPTTLSGYGITDAAPLASPGLTGTPTAPTAALATNNTQIATTAFVHTAIEDNIDTNNTVYFQDGAPTFSAFDEIWIDTNAGGLYKSIPSTSTVPLDSSMVSTSSSSITIPVAGASDTRLELGTGLPSGSVSFIAPIFIESFSSTGVNDPTLGIVTYADNTQATIDSNSISRATGNALDTKIKSFTFTSEGTTNSSNSHITLTVSGHPVWTLQDSDIQSKVDAVIDSAPGALDTLNELAAALGDDPNFSTTITNNLALKAPLASPALTGAPTAPTAAGSSNSTQIATTAFVQTAVAGTVSLTDFSVTSNTASGGGTLSYNNSSGVFSYTPPDLSSFLTSVSFASLTGKPTTIAGYGITDAFDGAFSSLSGKPTTISGYGITDALTTGADADIGSNDFITTGKAYFSNVFSQTSNLPNASTYHGMFAHVHATGAAYFAHAGNWVRLANQSEIFSGAFSALTGTPTTLSGYGITDAAPLASPALTGTPTAPTAASGTNTTQIATTAYVQSAVSGFSAGANVSVSGNAPSSPSAGDLWFDDDALVLYVYYADGTSNQWVQTNPSSVDPSGFDGTFAGLTNKPTTLSGYGITDGATLASPTFTGTPAAPTASSGTNTTQLATTAFVQQEVTAAGSYNDASVDTHLNTSTASANEVLSYNGTDYAWVAQPVQEFIKAYRYDDTLAVSTGEKRLYLQKAYTLKSIHAYVDTAPAGAAVNVQVKKNGANLQVASIAAGATTGSVTSLSHSIAANDYLTIDITQVGSSTAGENLYLVFTFN